MDFVTLKSNNIFLYPYHSVHEDTLYLFQPFVKKNPEMTEVNIFEISQFANSLLFLYKHIIWNLIW